MPGLLYSSSSLGSAEGKREREETALHNGYQIGKAREERGLNYNIEQGAVLERVPLIALLYLLLQKEDTMKYACHGTITQISGKRAFSQYFFVNEKAPFQDFFNIALLTICRLLACPPSLCS